MGGDDGIRGKSSEVGRTVAAGDLGAGAPGGSVGEGWIRWGAASADRGATAL